MVHTPGRIGDGPGGDQEFPWHLGVFDAHCHPTDTLDGLQEVPKMKARVLTIMSTRLQDQELVSQAAVRNGIDLDALESTKDNLESTCQILPSFGWHPWFSHQMVDDTETSQHPSKMDHYQTVLTPPPDQTFVDGLEDTQSLSQFLAQTRDYLEKHPHAMIGEIGLDRSMRIPENTIDGRAVSPEPGLTPGGRENRRLSKYKIDIHHQQKILLAQLRLAGELNRAVSVHGVAVHGFLFDTISSTWKGHERKVISKRAQRKMRPGELEEPIPEQLGPKPYPPRICLHSYSGAPDTIGQYLQPTVPTKIFFSFSQVINFAHGSNKAIESIKVVPDDRILVESDMHRAGERMDSLLADVVKLICEVKAWTLDDGVKRLAANWKHFALGIEP